MLVDLKPNLFPSLTSITINNFTRRWQYRDDDIGFRCQFFARAVDLSKKKLVLNLSQSLRHHWNSNTNSTQSAPKKIAGRSDMVN